MTLVLLTYFFFPLSLFLPSPMLPNRPLFYRHQVYLFIYCILIYCWSGTRCEAGTGLSCPRTCSLQRKLAPSTLECDEERAGAVIYIRAAWTSWSIGRGYVSSRGIGGERWFTTEGRAAVVSKEAGQVA
jgi:hypothetical protein